MKDDFQEMVKFRSWKTWRSHGIFMRVQKLKRARPLYILSPYCMACFVFYVAREGSLNESDCRTCFGFHIVMFGECYYVVFLYEPKS